MKNIDILHFTVAKKMTTARHCSNPVKPGLTGFEQLIKFVSSNWLAAKSVEQMTVEQSHFEQFTPTPLIVLVRSRMLMTLVYLIFLTYEKMKKNWKKKCFTCLANLLLFQFGISEFYVFVESCAIFRLNFATGRSNIRTWLFAWKRNNNRLSIESIIIKLA